MWRWWSQEKNLFFSFPKYCIIKCIFRKINVFETKYKAFSFIQFWWGSPYTIYKTIHDFEVCPRNTIYYNSGGYPHKNKYSTNIYTRKIDLVGGIGSNKVVVDDIKFEKELGRWSILGDFLSFGAICETGRGGKTNADNGISLKFFLSKLSITKPYGNLWLVVDILLCPHLQFYKTMPNFEVWGYIYFSPSTNNVIHNSLLVSFLLHWTKLPHIDKFWNMYFTSFRCNRPPLQVVCDQQVEMNDNKKKVKSESEQWKWGVGLWREDWSTSIHSSKVRGREE